MSSVLRKIKHKAKQILFAHLPRKWVHSYVYYKSHGKKMDWENPKTYDEKIHWLIVNMYDESYGKYADKWAVREYVKECGYEDLLVPVYGVYDKSEDIDYDSLPDEFVLMVNDGSGGEFYEICFDKAELDQNAVNKKLNKALTIKYWKRAWEYQYKEIPPKIMCLKLLKNEDDKRLTDYKVVCVNGKAVRILVCTNRDEGRDYYTTDWKHLDHVAEGKQSGFIIEKPPHLDLMLKAAEKLAAPFPLARIDFYEADGKLYFGEVTLTPCGGNHGYLTETGQIEWGGRSISLAGKQMKDYKIHCSYGKALCVLVCTERETKLKLDYYSLEWELLDYITEDCKSGKYEEKPKHLTQMIEAAEKLSKPFPASRIDFYEADDRIYFGEVTLTPACGNLHYLNEKGQYALGEKTILPI